jgi:hypothetical protein
MPPRPGSGFAREPPVWMKPGDGIEVTIEGVGTRLASPPRLVSPTA